MSTASRQCQARRSHSRLSRTAQEYDCDMSQSTLLLQLIIALHNNLGHRCKFDCHRYRVIFDYSTIAAFSTLAYIQILFSKDLFQKTLRIFLKFFCYKILSHFAKSSLKSPFFAHALRVSIKS